MIEVDGIQFASPDPAEVAREAAAAAASSPSEWTRRGGDPLVSAGASALLRDRKVYTITLYPSSGKSGYFAAHLHCSPGAPIITAHIEGLTTIEQEAAAVRELLARRGLAPSEVSRWELATTARAATARKWGQTLLAWLDLRGVQIHIREITALHSETDQIEEQSAPAPTESRTKKLTLPPGLLHTSPGDLADRLEPDAALVRLLNLSEYDLAQVHAAAGFNPPDIRAWLRARVIS